MFQSPRKVLLHNSDITKRLNTAVSYKTATVKPKAIYGRWIFKELFCGQRLVVPTQ